MNKKVAKMIAKAIEKKLLGKHPSVTEMVKIIKNLDRSEYRVVVRRPCDGSIGEEWAFACNFQYIEIIFTSQFNHAIMSQIKTQMNEQQLSRNRIEAIVSTLNQTLKTDMNLAHDLLLFLEERGIQIPALSTGNMQPILNTRYDHQLPNGQAERLRGMFDDLDTKENILWINFLHYFL